MGLLKFVAPSLPIASTEYNQGQYSQLLNALRIYFNHLDNAYWNGTKIINPYAAIQDTGDQYATAANTATQVTFDTTDYINSLDHITNDGLRVAYSGIYNIQFSLQFSNTDSQIHEAIVWLKKKGPNDVSSTNIPSTGSKFSVPNKHGGVDGYLIAAVNFYVQLEALDTIELWWEGSAIRNSTGTTDGIYIEGYAAAGAVPAIPSAVLTMTYVSAIP